MQAGFVNIHSLWAAVPGNPVRIMTLPATESNDPRSLPPPDYQASRHSQIVYDALCKYISEHNGVINFEQYMAFVLYQPGLGYYSSGNQKFGAAGDFTTAPEISPLFSRCMANQCRAILAHLDHAAILELGAGSGIMACDILQHLERLGALPAEYRVLEVSADLRSRQRALIKQRAAHLFDRVKWLDTLPDPGSFSGVIIANEVIDAMPVRRFIIDRGQYRQLGVGIAADRLVWKVIEMDDPLNRAIATIPQSIIRQLSDGYITEINVQLQPWLAGLCACINQGAALLVDYGYPLREYFHPQRAGGTLLCHYRHRVHDDPFLHPGLQDISASVNFTALADNAVRCGFDVNGYTLQTYFLMGNGLAEEMQAYDRNDVKTWAQVSHQARILTLPGAMGEHFKAMALTKNFNHPLQGFSIKDQRARL